MLLFIAAKSDFALPKSIVFASIKDMLQSCAHNKDIAFIVVGEHFEPDFIEYCSAFDEVSIRSTQEAVELVKQAHNAAVIHFGATIKWAKSLPQYFFPLVLPNELAGNSFIKRVLNNRKFNKWLQNSSSIFSANDWSLSTLELAYPEYSSKIQSVLLPTITTAVFEWQELSAAKEGLTQGNNYFLAFAPLERFTAILKEFSIFKKWQLTTMHLVFVFDTQKQVDTALVLLKGYKFKEDISIYLAGDLCIEWLAATYAILWEDIHFAKSVWIEYAIQYDVPLLFENKIALPENWLKAGEVFSFTEKQALSNHFKLYYKDEVYRQARARMGKEWLENRNEKRSGLELFNNIVLSLNK